MRASSKLSDVRVRIPFTRRASLLNLLVHSAMSSSAVAIISSFEGRDSSCTGTTHRDREGRGEAGRYLELVDI